MTKALLSVPGNEIEAAVNSGMNMPYIPTDIVDYLYSSRYIIVIAIIGFIVAVVIIALIIGRIKMEKKRAEHKSTRYYIDEFHLLLKEEQTAAYSCEIWKRFRKWGGIPTGLTQNVKDLLASREIENIFENSDFIYMLNQAGGDRQILAKQLNISPHQLSYVTNSGAGEGLIFYGNVIIPFVDKFPKDTQLYKIMTTKPEEQEEN